MARTVMYEPGLVALAAHVRDIRHDVAGDVARDARRRCPVDSGELLGTIRGPIATFAADRIFVGTDHWAHVEYGTPPHVIEPSVKKALSWPDAPHPVKRVMHPGTDAQPFMRQATYTKRSLRVVG